jgi:anthraniloyl-CoA monooxygenase
VALLGDAAHTAHFSVGSGTKMAMEDAIALAAALEGDRTDPDTLDEALAIYENERGGPIARIQDAARPSLSWWEHFGRSYRHLPPWQFAFHFFSRSLPESKLRQRDPAFTDAVHAAWRAAHGGTEVLATPLTIAGASHSRRLVPVATTTLPSTTLRITAPDTEDGLDRAEATVARGLAAGACLVAVEGGTALTRRLLCEAARLDHGAVTMLIEDGNEDTARTAVLSGRADLVGVPA